MLPQGRHDRFPGNHRAAVGFQDLRAMTMVSGCSRSNSMGDTKNTPLKSSGERSVDMSWRASISSSARNRRQLAAATGETRLQTQSKNKDLGRPNMSSSEASRTVLSDSQ